MIPGLGRTGFDRNITLWGIFVPGTKDEVKSPWNWDWNSAKELLKYVSCIYIYIYVICIIYIYTLYYDVSQWSISKYLLLISHLAPLRGTRFCICWALKKGLPINSAPILGTPTFLTTGDSDGSQTVCYHVGPQWETPWQIYIYI